MGDKIQLVDDSVHVALEDPPPGYTASSNLEPTAPPTPSGATTRFDEQSTDVNAQSLPPEFLHQLRSSSQHGAPMSQPHWVPSSPTSTSPNIQQMSMGYGQRTPEVNTQQPHSTATVAVTSASQTVVVVSPERAPPSYFWLSCLVYWFCNICAGSFAMVFSMVSSNAAYANRMEDAKRYSRYALGSSVAGMSLGIVTVILIAKLWFSKH